MARATSRSRIIEDAITEDALIINPDGSINIAGTVIITPPGASAVDVNEFSTISSTTGIDTLYTITNTKTLTIQAMSGGAEEHTSGSIVELFEDPNGDKSVLNRIETVFANGDSRAVIVQKDFVGDGVRRILLRRRRYAANSKEMWGRWRGFEQ